MDRDEQPHGCYSTNSVRFRRDAIREQMLLQEHCVWFLRSPHLTHPEDQGDRRVCGQSEVSNTKKLRASRHCCQGCRFRGVLLHCNICRREYLATSTSGGKTRHHIHRACLHLLALEGDSLVDVPLIINTTKVRNIHLSEVLGLMIATL